MTAGRRVADDTDDSAGGGADGSALRHRPLAARFSLLRLSLFAFLCPDYRHWSDTGAFTIEEPYFSRFLKGHYRQTHDRYAVSVVFKGFRGEYYTGQHFFVWSRYYASENGVKTGLFIVGVGLLPSGDILTVWQPAAGK